MRHISAVIFATVLLLTLAAPAAVPAQQWSAEQQEVWAMIEDAWRLDMADEDWVAPYVHDDLFGWGSGTPAPRGKESVARWSRFDDDHTESLEMELFPVVIVVHGDMAVAHYFSSYAERDPDGKMVTTHWKQTDVVVRDGDGWKFIAWHGTQIS